MLESNGASTDGGGVLLLFYSAAGWVHSTLFFPPDLSVINNRARIG
jgi:hypothetical protein